MWRRLVARYLGVVEAVGSNPATQTKSQRAAWFFGFFFAFQVFGNTGRGEEVLEKSDLKCLRKHCLEHGELTLQDVFKFLHQSVFGCEHLVGDLSDATDGIVREFARSSVFGDTVVEPLDGPYCRVDLGILNRGMSADTLGKLFHLSARETAGDAGELRGKKPNVRRLLCGELRLFDSGAFDAAWTLWEQEGFCAVRHSSTFREKYMPSYRVISARFVPFLPLFCEIDRALQKGNFTLALEGGSASGKTTLSSLLAEVYSATVFHMDDFFLQPHQRTPERLSAVGGNVDWERFLEEVLIPAKERREVTYRKFDCSVMSLGEAQTIKPSRFVIVEGVYSFHPKLAPFYDWCAYLKIEGELQKERILKRNSPEYAHRFFEEWIPPENRYFELTSLEERCNLIIQVK